MRKLTTIIALSMALLGGCDKTEQSRDPLLKYINGDLTAQDIMSDLKIFSNQALTKGKADTALAKDFDIRSLYSLNKNFLDRPKGQLQPYTFHFWDANTNGKVDSKDSVSIEKGNDLYHIQLTE
jgi:hypothetical protein